MTLNGAIMQLVELSEHPIMPVIFRPAIQKVIETISELEENHEPHEIGYDDCANALLKMWMDDVLTDGEYYRIANKLNVKWGKIEVPESYKGVTE